MPHDANGNELKVGDMVAVFGVVTQINEGPDYCNCNVEVDAKMPPDMTTTNISAINTRQLRKANFAPQEKA